MTVDILQKTIKASESGDYKQVIELMTPLAVNGNSEAQFQLGFLYFTDAEVLREESTKWLGLAAQQNHPEALYWLACLSRDDKGVGTPDNPAGLELLKQAAEKGSARAQCDLGCMYATGEGVGKDLVLARKWYGLAAKAGHRDAQFNFGFMLLLGEGGPVDLAEGETYLEGAANAGDKQAARLLADSFETGKYGFSVNQELTHKWRIKEEELKQARG